MPTGTAIPPESFYGSNIPSSSSRQSSTTPLRHDVAAPTHSTPVAYKLNSSVLYTSLHFNREQGMRQLAREMTGRFVGPMPFSDFLNEFLPVTAEPPLPHWSSNAFKAVTEQPTEPAMYSPLIEALTPFCTSLELVDTSNHPDPEAGNLKPDIAAYAQDCGRDAEDITRFSKIEIYMELKFDENDDPFQTSPPLSKGPLERDSELGKDTLGQITSYAAAHLALQFRTCVYSVFICGHGPNCRARLLRWDRTGAVVTEAFPVQDDKLAKFFWRYNHLSPKARGRDGTVSDPSKDDADDIDNARQMLKLPPSSDLVVITVKGDGVSAKTMRLITGKPSFAYDASPTGRSTRGFVAYDSEREGIVFLKDTWRVDLPDYVEEGKAYETLHKHSIPNIAPCELSGDVEDHRTLTQDFVQRDWACRPARELSLVRLIHYRLVLGAVGAVLTEFSSTRELVVVVADAFEAHKLAWEKAGILHRDISIGNILITANGRGLLIDWDHCKRKEDLPQAARRGERTGTWQFMAARLLRAAKGAGILHTLQDDMESFVHVLGWLALRYTNHGQDPSILTRQLTGIFDDVYMVQDHAQGGREKRAAIRDGEIPQVIEKSSPGLHALLEKLTRTLGVRYEVRPPDDEEIAKHNKSLETASKFSDPLVREEFMERFTSTATAKYIERREIIQNSDWMLNAFRDALKDSDEAQWPKDRHKNALLHPDGDPSQRKRKADSELIDQHMPAQKIRRNLLAEEDSEDHS